MNCQNCGYEIKKKQNFCPHCGKFLSAGNNFEKFNLAFRKIEDIIKSKPFIIFSVVFAVLLSIFIITFARLNIVSQTWTYKGKELKYDKGKLHRLYKEGSDLFKLHQYDKNEDGYYIYGGSGSAEGFIDEYIIKKAPEFKEVIDTIWDYCYDTTPETEGMAGIRNCCYEKINN